ncbi:hypothetical protein JST97_07510 [bacterium]|nr:hypothetical protein [bacterium]
MILFWLVWFGAILGGYYHFVPQQSTRALFRKVYRSSAVLYIPPSAWSPFGELYLNRDESPVDLWFSEGVMIDHLIERRSLGKRAASRLPAQESATGPEMVASLMVSPVATRFRLQKLFVSRIGEENSVIDDSGQLVPRIQRINFLRISAYGQTPEQSRLRAQAWVEVFQAVLGELATEELERKAEHLRQILARTERKLSESKLAWREREMARSASEELQIANLERERDGLRSDVSKLQHRASWLQENLASGGISFARTTGLLVASEEKLQILRHQLGEARTIYKPDSEHLLALQEEYRAMANLRQWAQKMESESQLESQTQELRSKRWLLARVERELARLVARRPNDSTAITREKRSLQLDSWDHQVASWRQQLFQMRLQIRLGRADGSSQVIQPPRPGIEASRFQSGWQMRYKGFLAWIPLATFVAFMAAWLGSFWDKSGDIAWRVEKYLDCQVLESLPRLTRQDSLQWANATRQKFEES